MIYKVTQLILDHFLKDLGEEGEVRDRSVVSQHLWIQSGFFRRRLVTATLKECGTWPVSKDTLIISNRELPHTHAHHAY